MTRIVGHQTDRFLTAEARDYGGHYVVTHHQTIHALHATKGWRLVSHERKRHVVAALPPIDQWRNAHISVFQPVRRNEKHHQKLMQLSPDALEKAKLRHKWYRKQKFYDALREKLGQNELAAS